MYDPLNPVVRSSRIVNVSLPVEAVIEFFSNASGIKPDSKPDNGLSDGIRLMSVALLSKYFTIHAQSLMSYRELLETNPANSDDGVIYGVLYESETSEELLERLIAELGDDGYPIPDLGKDAAYNLYDAIENSSKEILELIEHVVTNQPTCLSEVKVMQQNLCFVNVYDDIRALRFSNMLELAKLKEE